MSWECSKRPGGKRREFGAGGAGVDAFAGDDHGGAEVGGAAGEEEGGGGVDEDDVTMRSTMAAEDGIGDFNVVFLAFRQEAGKDGAWDAEVGGGPEVMADAVFEGFKDDGGAGGADFVEAVEAVDDQCAAGATEFAEGFGHDAGGLFGGCADELEVGAGGVGEGAQEVEDGSHFEFDTRLPGVAHGGMVGGCEEEADADFANGAGTIGGGDVDVDAEGFEQIGAAEGAGRGASTVFGDFEAGAGDDEGGDGGDVEGTGAVAAGATGVEEQVIGGDIDSDGMQAHGAGKADDLIPHFAAHFDSDGEARDLGGGGLAVEDHPHGGLGILRGQDRAV